MALDGTGLRGITFVTRLIDTKSAHCRTFHSYATLTMLHIRHSNLRNTPRSLLTSTDLLVELVDPETFNHTTKEQVSTVRTTPTTLHMRRYVIVYDPLMSVGVRLDNVWRLRRRLLAARSVSSSEELTATGVHAHAFDEWAANFCAAYVVVQPILAPCEEGVDLHPCVAADAEDVIIRVRIKDDGTAYRYSQVDRHSERRGDCRSGGRDREDGREAHVVRMSSRMVGSMQRHVKQG